MVVVLGCVGQKAQHAVARLYAELAALEKPADAECHGLRIAADTPASIFVRSDQLNQIALLISAVILADLEVLFAGRDGVIVGWPCFQLVDAFHHHSSVGGVVSQ